MKAKTIKEAILISLEDFPNGALARDVFKNILNKKIFEFNKEAKTPDATVQAQLGTMVKNGDTRIKRFKNIDKFYCYYLSEFSANINNEGNEENIALKDINVKKNKKDNFHERDLHPLLCAYLLSLGISAKTIYHEESSKKEEHQKWLHPDIVGTKIVEFDNKVCNSFFSTMNKEESIRLYSYELKKEISNDYDLKRCFFQAVSNSSWANYGYLVVFDIKETLRDEIERLSNSFGIGFIHLKANPYESQTWFTTKQKSLDFKTIDRLCKINRPYEEFIKLVVNVVNANKDFIKAVKNELQDFCDKLPFKDKDDNGITKYCIEHNIPYSEENEC